MAERIKADEVLARFVAGLSASMQMDLYNALQAYHEQFYNELIGASGEQLPRAQGKVQAMQKVTDTVAKAREIVTRIDNLRHPPQQGNRTVAL